MLTFDLNFDLLMTVFEIPLTLTRICYFAILERTWDCPQPICPLIAIKLRNKDELKVWDFPNPTIPEFTTLGHILTFPGQVKQKKTF